MHLPFKPGLENLDDSYYPKMTYPDHGVVVREDSTLSVLGKSGVEAAVEKRRLLAELPSFGIPIVNTSFVMTEPQGTETAFHLVTEFIDGQSIAEYPEGVMAEAAHPLGTEMLDKLYEYLTYKIDTGEGFLSDIYGLHQFMYESKTGSLIMVDVGGHVFGSREASWHRFIDETMSITFLVMEAAMHSKNDPAFIAAWQEKAIGLCRLSAERNGLTMPDGFSEEIARALTEFIDEEAGSDEARELFYEIVHHPTNQAYRIQRDQMILEANANRNKAGQLPIFK